jgi:thiol-disulfide isomerase/thioredoxin
MIIGPFPGGERMHRALVLAALLSIGVLGPAGAFAREIKPWAGATTPPLALTGLDGRTVGLRDFRGRVLLVNFWATWCEPCREEIPALERLQARLKDQPFELLMVNYGESTATVKQFMAKLGVTAPVALDPEKRNAAKWRVAGLPTTFLVDARGRIRYSSFGEHDWSAGEPLALVERLVAESSSAQR